MTIQLRPAIAEALRLTRQGRLGEATAAIQAGLSTGRSGETGWAATIAKPAIEPPASQHATAAGSVEPARQSSPIEQGRFEERSHAGAAGRLDYRLYVPAGSTPGRPLLVMLHGCTQGPEDFARGTGMNGLADEFGFLVAYPRQTRAANPQGCWNWFRPEDQQRDRGEPSLIAGITRDVVEREGVDRARIFVAGLSAGGAEAAIMAAAYPDLYGAVGIHSGLACGSARDLPSALAAMRGGSGRTPAAGRRFVPLITVHGTRDATVNEINSREIVAAATAAAGTELRTRTETGRTAGGRAFSRTLSADAAGRVLIEQWTVEGLSHAWSGGHASGSYTDANGPDASRAMVRFFLAQQAQAGAAAA